MNKDDTQFTLFDVEASDEPEAVDEIITPGTQLNSESVASDIGTVDPPRSEINTLVDVPVAAAPETTDDEQAEGEHPTDGDDSDLKPWESLPAGTDADGHALIVTAAATYTPSGQRLTGPVDSIDKLDKLLHWAALAPHGLTAQVWFVGIDSCAGLGWTIDPGSEDDVDDLEQLRQHAANELTHTITATLPPLLAAGWELRGDPGYVIHLTRKVGKATQMVDLILEPYVWTYWNKDFGWGNRIGDMGILGNPAAGTYLPDDDLPAARELGRRLAWSVEHLDTLPGPTPARTGAAILDKIRRERLRTGKGIVVTAAGPLPPIDGPPRGDLEPPAGWSRLPDTDDLEGAAALVTIDQRAAYLASAGMLSFGYGRVRNLLGADAVNAAADAKPAFGIWRVTLPAAGQYALPEKLPLPHPAMRDDQPVQTWITTVSLDGLCAPIADGGMGLDVDDLDVTEAWVYEEQGRALDKWAKLIRAARTVAVDTDDVAMKRFLGACYKGYVGRMVNPDMWTATRMQHHHQPLWRAAIMAHCRWRGRRVAMRIARETGRWPIRTMTDSWVYLLGDGQHIADDSDALGKMTVEKHTRLTDEMLLSFAAAETTHEIRLAIASAYGTDVSEVGE
ncbi:hypothetical protein EV641_106213 [Rhodococcus sp. SMB37]|uniref:hypothetical protein n=1 Tax=Rhodococcus sp. SMB37 TaxID=2512213 RepID=UPI0010451140|nr:hypothetical protein [Rhodococcus sp. SMB37]TCN53567.1 hypothetical protein EV641_106213 [Rhodococcus sp. SMB37]